MIAAADRPTPVVDWSRWEDEPSRILKSGEAGGVLIAAFARQTGPGASIATEQATGRWLAACGSWFHAEGAASGEESRLLSRIGEIGPERLARELEGFFAIAYGDPATRDVFVLTDLMGSRHCFVRDLGHGLAISTSSLLLARLWPASLDPFGCEEYLRLGVVYEDRTLFREIKKLPPATLTRFSAGRLAGQSCYWRLADLVPVTNATQAVEEYRNALEGAARRIVRRYPHPVCDLTAGYDSRLMAAAMMWIGADFETTVSGPAQSPDVVISRRLAAITGRPHWRIEPPPLDEAARWRSIERSVRLTDGEYDPVEYSRILSIHETLASKHFDASLNGSYGEIARGYWWEALGKRIGANQPPDPRALARDRYAAAAQESLFSRPLDLVEHLSAIIAAAIRELPDSANPLQMDHVYLRLRMQRWQGRIASSTDQVWPCLSFFFLRSVLEAALGVDWKLRRRNGLIHQVLPALSPALATVPFDAQNWPRFLAGLPQFAEKLRTTVRGRILKSDFLEASRVKQSRQHFRASPPAREILTLPSMKLAGLLDEKLLRRFLADSLHEDFRFDAGWNRLLGLEIALR